MTSDLSVDLCPAAPCAAYAHDIRHERIEQLAVVTGLM